MSWHKKNSFSSFDTDGLQAVGLASDASCQGLNMNKTRTKKGFPSTGTTAADLRAWLQQHRLRHVGKFLGVLAEAIRTPSSPAEQLEAHLYGLAKGLETANVSGLLISQARATLPKTRGQTQAEDERIQAARAELKSVEGSLRTMQLLVDDAAVSYDEPLRLRPWLKPIEARCRKLHEQARNSIAPLRKAALREPNNELLQRALRLHEAVLDTLGLVAIEMDWIEVRSFSQRLALADLLEQTRRRWGNLFEPVPIAEVMKAWQNSKFESYFNTDDGKVLLRACSLESLHEWSSSPFQWNFHYLKDLFSEIGLRLESIRFLKLIALGYMALNSDLGESGMVHTGSPGFRGYLGIGELFERMPSLGERN